MKELTNKQTNKRTNKQNCQRKEITISTINNCDADMHNELRQSNLLLFLPQKTRIFAKYLTKTKVSE